MTEERRLHQRRKIYVSCQVEGRDRLASARIIDASESGIAILVPEDGEYVKGEARVHIPPAHQPEGESPEAIALRTQVVDHQKKSKGHRLGLKIVQVESGDSEWKQLCRAFH